MYMYISMWKCISLAATQKIDAYYIYIQYVFSKLRSRPGKQSLCIGLAILWGKSQESWYLKGSFTASSCSGNVEWETQVQHHQSPALRVLPPVKECSGKSPSTLLQTLCLQPAFLQLLGARRGDPGMAVVSAGRILFTICMKKSSSDGKTWRTAEIPEVLNLHGYLLMCFH